jgi:hypothetical protein
MKRSARKFRSYQHCKNQNNKTMSVNLNNYFIETTDRYYNRLVRIYENRLAKANNKQYTHNEFVKYCMGVLEIRFGVSEREEIVQMLEHEYKIGKEFELAIKLMRKNYRKRISDNSALVSEYESDNGNSEYGNFDSTDKSETVNIDQYSDLELIRLFAEFKAAQRFDEFLISINPSNSNDELSAETVSVSDLSDKSKEFTTARQVLAIHYLLKYSNVKNVDKTEIARFIQFLTDKNFDNIYKKLQNPFKLNNKSLKEDLRFIRDYFERLGVLEVVKMINNEINVN